MSPMMISGTSMLARLPAPESDGSAHQLACGVTVAAAAVTDHAPYPDRRAALLAAREAIRRVNAAAADTLVLTHRPHAPPTASTQGGELSCALSIAHRRGRAVAAAAAAAARIGVDLEPEQAITQAQLRFFATARERAAGISPTLLWVLKEAAWKALRCPSSLPFHGLALELTPVGSVTGVWLEGALVRANAHVWSPWRGWIAAVVIVNEEGAVA